MKSEVRLTNRLSYLFDIFYNNDGNFSSIGVLPLPEKLSKQTIPEFSSFIPFRIVFRSQPSSLSALLWPPLNIIRTTSAMNCLLSDPFSFDRVLFNNFFIAGVILINSSGVNSIWSLMKKSFLFGMLHDDHTRCRYECSAWRIVHIKWGILFWFRFKFNVPINFR